MVEEKKEKKRRRRAWYLPKDQATPLSAESLRAAVLDLLELAVGYEVRRVNPVFERDPGAEVPGSEHAAAVLDTDETLEHVVNVLEVHRKDRRKRAVEAYVAEVLPRVCEWLRDPQSASAARTVDPAFLRDRIAHELQTTNDELLDALMRLAMFRRPLPRRDPIPPADSNEALPRRVVNILRTHKYLACSYDTISNIQAATAGGRIAGAIKTPEQARALREDVPIAPQEVVRYALLLFTNGAVTELVEAPLGALRAVVAKKMGTPQAQQGQPAQLTVDAREPTRTEVAPSTDADPA